ncbi:carbohydrate ABC transporter permease [Plantibacter sp. MMLR14_011]|uniref:carbohydrate ABC transporter permease n=1 Tax=Plantibacter sp. MMLR14_011 TaxID=1898746 RepID=UPI0009F3A826|nr:carbohydrate ABC transporter permease [Plantibacter sp. MMLR14_011]
MTAPETPTAPITPEAAGGARPPRTKRRRRGPTSDRPAWMGRPSVPVQALKALVIGFIVLVMLYPFVYIIAMSFASKDAQTSGFLPTSFSLDAYQAILAGDIVTRSLLISAFVTIVGTALSLTCTVMLAYGLSRTRQVPGSRAILLLVVFTMFFGAGIIPNYLLMKNLGLLNTLWSLILPGLISAFNMVVVRNFFMSIPASLIESARIDGASDFRILWKIVLPLSRPVLAVVGLFAAVGYWNSYFSALLYINDSSLWPVQVVLNQYVIQGSVLTDIIGSDVPTPPSQSVQMAVVVLATLPILIVYPFIQRHFTKGMLTGAIKG